MPPVGRCERRSPLRGMVNLLAPGQSWAGAPIFRRGRHGGGGYPAHRMRQCLRAAGLAGPPRGATTTGAHADRPRARPRGAGHHRADSGGFPLPLPPRLHHFDGAHLGGRRPARRRWCRHARGCGATGGARPGLGASPRPLPSPAPSAAPFRTPSRAAADTAASPAVRASRRPGTGGAAGRATGRARRCLRARRDLRALGDGQPRGPHLPPDLRQMTGPKRVGRSPLRFGSIPKGGGQPRDQPLRCRGSRWPNHRPPSGAPSAAGPVRWPRPAVAPAGRARYGRRPRRRRRPARRRPGALCRGSPALCHACPACGSPRPD